MEEKNEFDSFVSNHVTIFFYPIPSFASFLLFYQTTIFHYSVFAPLIVFLLYQYILVYSLSLLRITTESLGYSSGPALLAESEQFLSPQHRKTTKPLFTFSASQMLLPAFLASPPLQLPFLQDLDPQRLTTCDTPAFPAQ